MNQEVKELREYRRKTDRILRRVVSLLTFYKCTFMTKIPDKTYTRTEDLVKSIEKIINHDERVKFQPIIILKTMTKQFTDIGQLVATRAVADQSEEDPQYHAWIQECLQRYFSCDWGDLCAEDKELNDNAISSEGEDADRVLARYNNPKGDIYIITEWDRSVTTILHPKDY